jgi:hypothetical protein
LRHDHLEPGLRLIDSQSRLKYVARFLYATNNKGIPIVVPHKSPDFETHESLLNADRLGINLTGQHNTGDDYLVIKETDDIRLRSALQRKGGVHYFVDQEFNPRSICFRPGGIYKERNLISGRIGTASDDPDSLELYKTFTKAITKGFKKVGNYRVGHEALRLMDQGVRMITMGVDEPPEYDLRRK